jgi:hypothetical protein
MRCTVWSMRGSWVLVEIGEKGARARLHYVAHRIPRVMDVPLAVAASLAERGARLVVRGA